MIFHRIQGLIAAGGAAVLVAIAAQPAHAADPQVSKVAKQLQETMAAVNFGEVLDTAPPATARAAGVEVERERPLPLSTADATPIHQQPQVDVTVLELDRHGRPVSSGTVLMSPAYKDGVIVPVDRNFHTSAVRYRLWNTDEWNNNHGQGTVDTVPGRENAPIDFMSPYPASIVKLMVAVGILQLVDKGAVNLDDTYAYEPATPSARCGGATTATIRQYFDRMITISDNGAACALIKVMHEHNAVDGLNQMFQDLGLETLQLKGTNPGNGDWSPYISMSSLDTAKLLALVNGVRGRAWTAPDGTPVTSGLLSSSSREFFKQELGDQAWNNVLSTTNYCGYTYPTQGLPQLTPQRWIGPDGTVTIDDDPEGKYDNPVQPCQDAAQVRFAHKTGLTDVAAGDAGIVTSLPGKPWRSYIIVAFSNLGWRYIDPNRPMNPPVKPAVNRTEKFAKLGRAMDAYEADQ